MTVFVPQIDFDQVGSVLDHLPRYAHVDLNVGGRHLTAQITHDQRKGAAVPYGQIAVDLGGRKMNATVDFPRAAPAKAKVSGDAGVDLVTRGATVAGDLGAELVTRGGGAVVGLDSFELSAEHYEIVGSAFTNDGNVDPPEVTRYQIVGDDGQEMVGSHGFELSAQRYQIVGFDDGVGGFFNFISKKAGINKKIEKQIKKQTGKTVKIQVHNPSVKSVIKDVGHAVSVVGKVASLVVPGLGLVGAGATAIGIGGAAAKAKAAIHTAGAAVAADKLVAAAERGGKAAKTAAAVVRQTTHLAARGNVDAKAAVRVLQTVATQRRTAGIPRGAEQPVTAKGATALRAFAAAPKLDSKLVEKAPAAGRTGIFISTEPGSYGRIDFSQGGLRGKWRPA
jgi:hypothetical protein